MDRKILDVRGTKCPVPIVKAKLALDALAPGDLLEVIATDGGSVEDFKGWAATSKIATLEEQRTEVDESGRQIFAHVLKRKG